MNSLTFLGNCVDLAARSLALFACLPLLAAASLSSSKPKHDISAVPKDIIRFGCVVQQRENDPYYYTYVWALRTGVEPAPKCTAEIESNHQTGKPIDDRCYVDKLTATESRKKGLEACDEWMQIVNQELLNQLKQEKKKK